MQADGHCLYRAVGDQLDEPSNGAERTDVFWVIRARAAAYMRAHPDQFIPFMPEACSFSASFLTGAVSIVQHLMSLAPSTLIILDPSCFKRITCMPLFWLAHKACIGFLNVSAGQTIPSQASLSIAVQATCSEWGEILKLVCGASPDTEKAQWGRL